MHALALRYFNRETAWLVAAGVLLTTVIAGGVMFATAGPRGTALGMHLGADYASFYSAGLLQNRYGVARLYDLGLQDRVLHESVPGFPESDALPFPYPPFVAAPFRLLAALPYAWSYAAWLAASAALYATAVGLTLRVCPAIPAGDRVTVWLLALSFSPFAVETWLGGQISCLGAVAVAAALACHRTGRPGWAGVALAALLYKPTLVGLILLMLVAGRRWRTLAGFGGGVCAVAALSIAVAGLDGSLDYARFLVWFGRQREEFAGVFKAVKYLDLANCLSLLGLERGQARPLAFLLGLPVVAALALAWHRSRRSPERADLAWAATLCFLPVLSNYGPIYDAALLVPGLILAADAVRRRHPHGWPAGFSAVVAAVYVAGLASPFLADFGVQALTPALAAAGFYLLRAALVAEGAEAPSSAAPRGGAWHPTALAKSAAPRVHAAGR